MENLIDQLYLDKPYPILFIINFNNLKNEKIILFFNDFLFCFIMSKGKFNKC